MLELTPGKRFTQQILQVCAQWCNNGRLLHLHLV
jgi:hypothetical protein